MPLRNKTTLCGGNINVVYLGPPEFCYSLLGAFIQKDREGERERGLPITSGKEQCHGHSRAPLFLHLHLFI